MAKYSLNGDLLWNNSDRTIITDGSVDFTVEELSGEKSIILAGKQFINENNYDQIIIPFDSLGNPQHTSIFRFNTYNKPIILQFNTHRIVGVTTKRKHPYTEHLNDSDQVCIMDLGWNYPPYFITKKNDMNTEVLEDSTYLDTVMARDSFPGDHVTYFLRDTIPSGMLIDGNSGKISWTPLTEKDSGAHAITVVATDNAGQSDTLRFSIHVTPQNDPPIIDSIGILKRAYKLGDTVSLRAYARDEELDKLTYSWTKNGVVLPVSDSIISYRKTDSLIDTIILSVSDSTHYALKTLHLSPFKLLSIRWPDNIRSKAGLYILRNDLCFVVPGKLDNNSIYKISIFNFQGVLIKTIEMGGFAAGRFNLNTDFFKNGVYIIAITGPDIKLRRPFYVMK